MSAVAGLWHVDGRPGAANHLESMQQALFPFGADRAGAWDGGAVALGSRLTVLLPEDVHDRQPLIGGGGRFVLVADLRLDNRPELAEALGIERQRAEAMADSDLLLAAWERWREGCPARLLGAFAFALWDAGERRLHLVRDQMGDRPLFYHLRPGRIAFASMYHGLHALPDIPLVPDLGAVRAHAASFADYKDRSFHVGVKRVLPGSRLEIDADGSVRVDRYWELPDPPPLRLSSDGEYVEAFRETFDQAVRDRLRAIGPIGCHLSSGYDSSAVATTAAAMLAERGQRLTAYTAVPMAGVALRRFGGQIIDESEIASVTAGRHANIDHVLVGRDGRAIGEDFEAAFTHLQQPIRNACNRVWRVDIARRMQERGERILLSGAFGNLTVSHHGRETLSEMLVAGQWLRLARELRLLTGREASFRWLLMITLMPVAPNLVTGLTRRLTGRLLTRRHFSPLSEAALAAIRVEEDRGRWEDQTRIAADQYLTRRDIIRAGLFKADIGAHNAAMLGAYGTDERDASRDLRLIDLVLSLPGRMFLRDGQARWIYRQAFAGRLPPDVLTPLSRKGYQSADWMYRMAKGREGINSILDRARGIASIEEMFDMPDLIRLSRAELCFDHAHLPEVRDPLRYRFLTGICNIDFLLRAGLERTG